MADNAIAKIFRIKELRARIFYTIGMLLVFRIGAMIPVPGIDPSALATYLESLKGEAVTGLAGMLDFFSGGAFSRVSVLMLGVMPYISMQIIMQLLLLVFPSLKKISEEDGGRKKIQKYNRYGTVLLCIVESAMILSQVKRIEAHMGEGGSIRFDGFYGSGEWLFVLFSMISLTAGTMFLVWMGEQITARGIGNGISLLIFAGIVARMPEAVVEVIRSMGPGKSVDIIDFIIVMAVFVVVVGLVIYEQQGQRKIPVHYAKRVVGRKMYGGQNVYFPIKLNPSGVIPIIFASSIMQMGATIADFIARRFGAPIPASLQYGGIWFVVIEVILIIFFAFFYTQVTFNPPEIAKQIRENGGSIPGIRIDKTEEYLAKILNRIIFPGSLFLALIVLVPEIVVRVFGFPMNFAMLMGGTSLMIMVGVDLDTMGQIEGFLKMHHQDGIVKKGKIRSRNL